MFDNVLKIPALGRRFAEAGRQARVEMLAAAGPVGGEVAAAAAAAAGELVRCAVAGAITAVVRGPRQLPRQTGVRNDPWHELDDRDDVEGLHELEPGVGVQDVQEAQEARDVQDAETMPGNKNGSRWASATRAVGTALTVAAGAAASVPGGRLVAAGLGAVAAVAALATRAGENTSS